jgi:Uma2 family endonuclease
MRILPPWGEWTNNNLKGLPYDGLQRELFEGVVVVSPSRLPQHQRAVGALYRILQKGCPADLEVFLAPLDYQPSERCLLQPDLLVARCADVYDGSPLYRPLVLAVEVLADSTRAKDEIFKRALYERHGVRNFWLYDPKALAFQAYALRDGKYELAVEAVGHKRVEVPQPFPVEVCPIELSTG